MSMDTRQKLANTHEMHLPKIVELLDMGETSLQKVSSKKKKLCCYITKIVTRNAKNMFIWSKDQKN